MPQPETAAALDEVLGSGDLISRLAADAHADRRPWMRSWLEHERRAVLLRLWDLALVPGLLQSEAYMREVFGGDAGVDDLVASRRERQAAVLDRQSPAEVSCLISDIALRQGSPAVRKEQLDHLVDMSHRPNVSVRMVPAGLPVHVGLGGSIALATLPDGHRIGWLDDPLAGKVVTTYADLIRLEIALETIAGLALSVAQSRDHILEISNAIN